MVTRSPRLPPLALSLAALAVLLPAAPALAAPTRQAELVSRIDERIREPGVAADLYELAELAPETEDLGPIAKELSTVAGSSRARRDVRSLAAWLLASVERQRGRMPRMQERLDSLGIVRDLAFVGPFDDENHGGFDVAYGPEKNLDLNATYDGLRNQVRWRTAPELAATGTVRLYEGVRPGRDVVVYVATVLQARRDVRAVLHLGTSGATRAWLSGRPILADPAYHPAAFDQGEIPVELHRGDNVLVLKMAAGQEAAPALILRVVGAGGEPIEGLTARAPTGAMGKLQPIPAGKVIRARDPLVDDLTREARRGGVAMRDLARVLGERHGFDDQEKKHTHAAAEAARALPDDPAAQLLAARYETEDGNQRRLWLERAVAAEKSGARAHAALASWWLERGNARAALDLIDPALAAAAPDDVSAGLLRARALDSLGLPSEAQALVMEMARDRRDPRLLLEKARWLRRDGRVDEAEQALRVLLSLHPADGQASAMLSSILTDRGRLEDALRVYEGEDRIEPGNLAVTLAWADLLAQNGRLDEAGKLYARAAALSPQESDVFERAAKASLLAGDHPGAAASLRKAIALRPQEARLKELLQSVEPQATAFAKPYLRDVREVVAGAKGNWEGEDAVTLLDLTAIKVAPSGQASRTTEVIVKTLTQRGVDSARGYPIRYAPDREDAKVERARILKADGTVVDSHGESDRSLTESWSGMWFDARVLQVTFPGLEPGDTVELVYRVDDVARDNLLSDYFGDVDFVQDQYLRARWEYVLDMPAGRELYAHHPTGASYEKTTQPDGSTLHHWVQKDVPRVVAEPSMPGWAEVASYLHVSTYKDWESVARFWWGLVKEQVAPTPEIEKTAREIVKNIPERDVPARVQAVYDYVVEHTHYVGLEFGIHSFKPYKVDKILARGFGDCKDKASLTYSLLKALGIESRLVLLRMRHLGKLDAEPASLAVFNHAILYVPSLDLFLDGTAEFSGSGELPESDRGAEALVVNPAAESKFEVTPEAPAEAAVTTSVYRIALASDGSARMGGDSEIAGIPAAGYRRAYASPNGRRSSFEQAWAHSFPGLTVAKLDVSDLTRLEQAVKLDFGLEVPHFAETSQGGALSFSPFGSATRYVETYAPLSQRRYDLVLGHPWVTRFRYEVTLPAGATPAQLPPAVDESTPFGGVKLAYRSEGGKVMAEGEVRLAVARVPAADYPSFRTFLGRIDRALAARVEVAPAQARR